MNEKLKTFLLAIAGLVVAISLSIATLQLSHQKVGITAEPIDAGSDLAPRALTGPTDAGSRTGGTTPRDNAAGGGLPASRTGGDSAGDGSAGANPPRDFRRGDSRNDDAGKDHGGDTNGDDHGTTKNGNDDHGGEDHDDD